jgi:hypothetical protein
MVQTCSIRSRLLPAGEHPPKESQVDGGLP